MEGTNYIVNLFVTGGLVMYPLLALSLITVAIGIERWYFFRLNTKGGRGFSHGVYHSAKAGNWREIDELCQQYPLSISRVVHAGCSNRESEQSMKNAFMEQMTFETSSFKRYLDYLSAIVTVAPLLGLLGTVTGMIGTFGVLDNGGGAAAITGGIGEALIATATGLCVAIIAFAIYTYFSHRLDQFVIRSEELCLTMVNAMKKEW